MLAAPNGLEALAQVMRYILMVNDHVEPQALKTLLERVAGPAAKDTIMTAGERLILQGEEQGIQRGQGALLLRLLRRRFGPSQVSAEVEQRLAAASTGQIEGWADRVLSASTIDEVFAD